MVSFGVAAPLSIAGIAVAVNWLAATFGVALVGNVVAASIATGAAVLTAVGVCGCTFFAATTGRKQGPALAIDKFLAQKPEQATAPAQRTIAS